MSLSLNLRGGGGKLRGADVQSQVMKRAISLGSQAGSSQRSRVTPEHNRSLADLCCPERNVLNGGTPVSLKPHLARGMVHVEDPDGFNLPNEPGV